MTISTESALPKNSRKLNPRFLGTNLKWKFFVHLNVYYEIPFNIFDGVLGFRV